MSLSRWKIKKVFLDRGSVRVAYETPEASYTAEGPEVVFKRLLDAFAGADDRRVIRACLVDFIAGLTHCCEESAALLTCGKTLERLMTRISEHLQLKRLQAENDPSESDPA